MLSYKHSRSTPRSPTRSIPTPPRHSGPLWGCSLMIFTSLLLGLSNCIAPMLSHVSFSQLLFVQYIISTCLCSCWLAWNSTVTVFPSRPLMPYVVARGMLFWASMFLLMWSIYLIGVYAGLAIHLSFPIWVSLLGHFHPIYEDTDENPTTLDPTTFTFVLLGYIGILCGSQPFWNPFFVIDKRSMIGVFLAIVSSFFTAIQHLIVFMTRVEAHWLQQAFVTSLLSCCLFSPIVIAVHILVNHESFGSFRRWNLGDLLLSCVLGWVMFCVIVCWTWAAQNDIPSRTALWMYTQIIVVILFVTFSKTNSVLQWPLPAMSWVSVGIIFVAVVIPAGWQYHEHSLRTSMLLPQPVKFLPLNHFSTTHEEIEESESYMGWEDSMY